MVGKKQLNMLYVYMILLTQGLSLNEIKEADKNKESVLLDKLV
jgi:hypothetical protein